jgi:ribosomal protein L11 methyltransferase
VIRLAVRCRPELAERVLAELTELAPGGVEEERGRGYVEYAVYGAPGELPAVPDLEAAAGEGLVEIHSSEVPDDWADRWQDFHQPILVGERLWVRPSWERGAAPPGAVEVVVDPGRAFGTGAHATTRLSLELLLEAAERAPAPPFGALADWGTGSGVLAIAAAKLGWSPVLACDHERSALDAAAANAAANAVEIELRRVNLRGQPPPCAPTVLANLTAPVLLAAAEWLADVPAVVETLICSGLLENEVDEVANAFERAGLRREKARRSGEWVALLLGRVPPS